MSETALVRYPDGENPPMTDLAERLRDLMGHGLDYLVLYDQDTAKVALGGAGQERDELVASGHERTGRMIYYVLRELEPDFAGLRTGALIRTVLQLPGGTIFYYLVEPGIHLYGSTAEVSQIERLDASIADSVNDLRAIVRYSPLDFGSFSSMRAATVLTAAPSDAGHPAGETGDPGGGTPGGESGDSTGTFTVGGQDTSSAAVLRRALHSDGLHYLAYYDARSLLDCVDIFERPTLRNFFRSASVEDRRDRYRRLGALLPGVLRRMNEHLSTVVHGRLIRVVLDVEQGAVYFHALPGSSRFLIGVTLDQSRVAVSDEQMMRTARDLAALTTASGQRTEDQPASH